MVSPSQVITVLVQAGALQLCFWPGLARHELAVQHIYSTTRLPIAHEQWSRCVPTELLCLRSWLDLGLQPGCCAYGKSESSNPTPQHSYVQRACVYDSSDSYIYHSSSKACLTAVLAFGKYAGMACYHESSALVYCSRTRDPFQQGAEETVTSKPVSSPTNVGHSPILKHLGMAGLSWNYSKRWKGCFEF